MSDTSAPPPAPPAAPVPQAPPPPPASAPIPAPAAAPAPTPAPVATPAPKPATNPAIRTKDQGKKPAAPEPTVEADDTPRNRQGLVPGSIVTPEQLAESLLRKGKKTKPIKFFG